jgi:hypothetical protein
LFNAFSMTSFFSIWYWVLIIGIWSAVNHRTLGVPYDMLLRAGRLPEVAARVDVLAEIAAGRLASLRDRLGVPLAALAGFALAVIGGVGFLGGLEVAQAAFALGFPLALVGAATIRLALEVRQSGVRGAELRAMLVRRHRWNQTIGFAAILATALLALAHPPRGLYY